MVASVVLMTVVYGIIYERVRLPYLEEKRLLLMKNCNINEENIYSY